MTTRPSVLVVDDDQSTRELLTEILCDEGYAVLEAVDGLAAIRAVDRERGSTAKPALLLLDLRLPDVDGLGVLHHLAAHGDDVPVVAMSGSPELLTAALAAGARGILSKPFDLVELLDIVATCAAPDDSACDDHTATVPLALAEV